MKMMKKMIGMKVNEMMTQEAFFAISGVSYSDNNVRRQVHVKEVKEGQELYAVPDDQNAFDDTAIKIYADAQLSKPLGFVPKEIAHTMRTRMTQGWTYKLLVKRVTGGPAPRLYGCNVRIIATKSEEGEKTEEEGKKEGT